MNAKKFSDALSALDGRYVEEAARYRRKHGQSFWVRWGAAAACLIDINPDNARRNIALFPKEQGLIKLLKADALKLPQAAEAYNLLFMDAPYAKGLSEPALRRAAEQGWLQDGCLCVIELEKNEAFDLPSDFERLDERCYGIARFLFARYGR